MSEDAYTINIKPLEQLMKALKTVPTARIGVLGDNDARDDGRSNATIGAAHEFGTSKLPQRSFLRVPLEDHLNEQITRSGLDDKEVLNQVIKTGSALTWMKKICVVAEAVVKSAFDTGGDGKWPISDMTHKTNQQTLIESTQLMNSIHTEVKE